MFTILIVEDDIKLCQLFSIVLGKHGYRTLSAHNGVEAWEHLEKEYIDLMITDLMMPEMDGYELISSFRSVNSELPILIVTAKDDISSKSKGFSLGTDDYMTKPVDVNEMVLRVGALLRRAKIAHERKQMIGATCLDYDSMTISRNGTSFMLPQKEFLLLYKLISYPNKIFTRRQLMDEIWGMDSESDAQTVDVHINRLRRHFEDNPDFEIVTVRGLGYKIILTLKEEPDET